MQENNEIYDISWFKQMKKKKQRKRVNWNETKKKREIKKESDESMKINWKTKLKESLYWQKYFVVNFDFG